MSTSTRSIAPAGMLLRSTPALSPGEAKFAMRRPLSSTSVPDTPMPRRLAPLKPRWPELLSVMLAPSVSGAVMALTVLSSSAAVETPESRMSSRLMVCTGSAGASSSRLMREPVTVTVSRPDASWACDCARAGACAARHASETATATAERRAAGAVRPASGERVGIRAVLGCSCWAGRTVRRQAGR